MKELIKNFKKPNIKKEKLNNNHKIYALFLIAFYILQYFFLPESISNFFLKTLHLPLYLYFFLLDIITIFFAILIFSKELKSSLKSFLKQKNNYFEYILCSLFIYSILNLIIITICNFIVKDIPTNQQALESYNILYLLFGTLIYAPCVEELVFRGCIRKFIKNNTLFIIISGLFFGLNHVIGSSSLIQYIFILDYGFAGMYLAYLYTKFNNIYLNITTHFILNLMGVLNIIFNLV